MAFFPILTSSDERGERGAVALAMQNVTIEPAPAEAAKRTPFFIAPTPGLLHRITPSSGNNIRGLYCKPGVRDGNLIAAAGRRLFSISPDFVGTDINGEFLTGSSGRVLFDNLGSNLFALANNDGFYWDGATVTQVTDADFPPGAHTLASLADRILSSTQGSDQFDWSSVGNALTWPALGFASSARQPDEIRSQIVLGGDLWHFGATTAQVWRAVGGDDEDAFDLLASLVIDRGIITRDAIAKLDSSAMWIGEDRVGYRLNGYAPERVVNRDLELRLAALSDQDILRVFCLGYLDGSHLTCLINVPGAPAYEYDLLMEKWRRRATFGQSGFQIAHYARFGGHHMVASASSDKIWSWESATYSDDGTAIERVITVHVPFQGANTPVSILVLDMKTFGQPLTGQGSDPVAMISFSRTGGTIESIPDFGIERMVKLGQAGNYRKRPMLTRLGAVSGADGFLMKIRITDPVGFNLSGVWVNEIPQAPP